jgi:hypothetical protein
VNPDELDLLEQVVLQIRAGDAREQGGHRPTMNFPTSEAAGALCIEGICSTYAPMTVGRCITNPILARNFKSE